MEVHDKETLVVQRANLVDNLNIRDGLFTQLISRKLLTQRQVRSIQNGRTIDEQVEELLDRLPTLGKQSFTIFCDALINDGQEDVVNMYLKREPHLTSGVNSDKYAQESCSNGRGIGDQGSIDHDTHTRPRTVASDNARPRTAGNDAVAVANTKLPSCVQGQLAVSSLHGSTVVQEEFKQQTYRRNIQPSGQESRLFPDDAKQVEQEVKHFYQNILTNPNNVVCSVLNAPQNGNDAFKNIEKSLYERSPSKLPVHMPYNGMSYNDDGCRSREMTVPDSASKSSHLSNPVSNGAFPTANSMFHPALPVSYLLQQTMPSSVPKSPFKERSDNSSQFHFKTMDTTEFQDTNVSSHDNMTARNLHNSRSSENVTDIEMSNVQHHAYSTPSKHAMNTRESLRRSPVVVERDTMELPRYIEMDRSHGEPNLEREFVSMPRYIERMQPSQARAEESGKGDYSVVSRLARNDSVDTMNKRPGAQPQDSKAKRFCAEIESIPTLIQPDQQTTLQFYNNVDQQIISIPTLDPSPRKPAIPPVIIATESEQENYGKHVSNGGVMDDPEIDLTDGPVNVKVEQCTRQFYINHYKQSYVMRRIPRGKALILNVNEVVGKSPRRGTDIDRDNLHNLLCQLHFDVTVFNDEDGLTAKEMVLKLQDFSQHMGHYTADAAVICILSHGEEGYIFGADGKKFELDGVFSLFDNTCCSALMGKPKLFIIQACRGGALDRGVVYCQDETDGSDPRMRQVPSMSDMIICYPTQQGYYAWRNRDRGSWYVEALVQVIMKFAKCEDMCTMLNRINLLVSKKVSHCPQLDMDQMCQMSEYKSTLRMPHLYFFPGIGGGS